MAYKIGDHVLLPKKANYNPKYDRDMWGVIREVRQGRHTSYKIGNTWYLEEMLREMGGTAIHSKQFYPDNSADPGEK